ncbi:MAG: hypothetical protein MUC94_18245 [bacterium]|nr:hypothetical protein [bacterium]
MRKLNFTIVLFAMMMLVIGCGGQKEKAVVEDIVAFAQRRKTGNLFAVGLQN